MFDRDFRVTAFILILTGNADPDCLTEVQETCGDESLADVATEQYGGNRSEAIRDLIIKGLTADDRATEYEQRIEELERERDRLREQLAATNQRVDEHQELVEYVETERTLSERRAQAGVLTRAKWWLTGMPADTDSDGE